MTGKNEELLKKYFPELFEQYSDILNQLHQLYIEWNSKINVVSRKDIDNLYLHHILHSVVFVKYATFEKETRILDVGTGGGLPGIPLSILFPESEFVLVDGRNKKILVANEIISALGLKNIRAIQTRSEELNEKFDFITGRAVIDYTNFIKMVKPNMKPNGRIFYWTGGNYKTFNNIKGTKVFKLEDFFAESHFKDKYILKY